MCSRDSMDDDRNGLPCESFYPPATLARVAASSLSLRWMAPPTSLCLGACAGAGQLERGGGLRGSRVHTR